MSGFRIFADLGRVYSAFFVSEEGTMSSFRALTEAMRMGCFVRLCRGLALLPAGWPKLRARLAATRH
ncbi:hypothetical protein [Tateyamaria sp.]|uniref:hypothetical protein n=1 Tax=Tateyamaria sp. TaxID=1929288 RepID=UPI003B224B2D